jgi:hypothetical protein
MRAYRTPRTQIMERGLAAAVRSSPRLRGASRLASGRRGRWGARPDLPHFTRALGGAGGGFGPPDSAADRPVWEDRNWK